MNREPAASRVRPAAALLRRMMPRACPVVAGLLALGIAATASAKDPPEVESFVNDQLGQFRKLAARDRPQRLPELRRRLETVVNFERFARAALGKRAEKYSTTTVERFTTAFRTYLEATYLRSPERIFAERELRVTNSRNDGQLAEAEGVVQASDVDVVWRIMLHNDGGRWRVHDIIIDEMSMVEDFRFQFSEYLRKHSVDELIDYLTRRAARESPRGATQEPAAE